MKPIIYIPKQPRKDIYNHCGDTFRNLICIWEKINLVDIIYTETDHVWWNGIGNVLLYDRPTYNWMQNRLEYNIGLFGNHPPPNNYKNNHPWIFWGRNPEMLDRFSNRSLQMKFKDRTINTIFLGKIENEVQNQYRDILKWKPFIEEFSIVNKNEKYKYTQQQYLELLLKSKYGLCLRGYGPKCNREIELMAMGVVPLITPDVDITYYNEIKENIHFLRIEKPEDIERVINGVSQEKWQEMSNNCIQWYKQNCSVEGSFETTKKIIDNHLKDKEQLCIDKLHSICTLATHVSKTDIILFLHSNSIFHRNIPIYIACDSKIEPVIKDLGNKLHLNVTTVKCLDQYSKYNRQEMEKLGIWTEFMLRKCDAIDAALENHPNTMFLDSDILTLGSVSPFIDFTKEIGISHHRIKKINETNYGKYNGGFVYVANKEFTKWWKDVTKTSRFFEQACLERVPEKFTYFEFAEQCNFGWWRLFESFRDYKDVLKEFTVKYDNTLFYRDTYLQSIHTHFDERRMNITKKFNQVVQNLFNQIDNNLYKYLLNEINNCIDNLDTMDMVVCTQYYNDPQNERQKELDYCILRNLDNQHVKYVYNFCESKTEVPFIIKKHPKYKEIKHDKWLKYSDVIDYANKNLNNYIIAMCNLDIFLDYDSNWKQLSKNIVNTNNKLVYCLSRFEYQGDGTATLDPVLERMGYANSQDTWLFKAPIHNLENIDFEFGKPGCDNAIAERFKRAGYIPVNDRNTFKTFHYDLARGKTGSNYKEFAKQEKYKNNSPEQEGQYLIPYYGYANNSLDEIAKIYNYTDLEKYTIMCEMISRKIKIKN